MGTSAMCLVRRLERGERENRVEEKSEEEIVRNFPEAIERHKFLHLKSPKNPKQDQWKYGQQDVSWWNFQLPLGISKHQIQKEDSESSTGSWEGVAVSLGETGSFSPATAELGRGGKASPVLEKSTANQK